MRLAVSVKSRQFSYSPLRDACYKLLWAGTLAMLGGLCHFLGLFAQKTELL